MKQWSIVTCMNEFYIGFIDHFNTQLVNTFNYSVIADLHILQITRVQTLAYLVFTRRFLVTVSNNGYFSASMPKSYLTSGSLPSD
jgi:hypothetical protein